MKVTRKQYEKALKDLPKMRKSQEIVEVWKKGAEDVPAGRELIEVERSDLGLITTKTCKRETQGVDGGGDSEAA